MHVVWHLDQLIVEHISVRNICSIIRVIFLVIIGLLIRETIYFSFILKTTVRGSWFWVWLVFTSWRLQRSGSLNKQVIILYARYSVSMWQALSFQLPMTVFHCQRSQIPSVFTLCTALIIYCDHLIIRICGRGCLWQLWSSLLPVSCFVWLLIWVVLMNYLFDSR